MSDLRHPTDQRPGDGAPTTGRAIDPDSPDFVSQFDREFGSPAVDRDGDAGEEAGSEPDTALAVAPAAGERSQGARILMRVGRRPYQWVKRPWPDDRVVQVATSIAVLVVTTYIMMQVVHWNPLSSGDDLVNDTTTPTGGDMGAHVWGPPFLRDHLLPNGQLSGWSMDWYGGLPVYRFYMLIPALMIVALDTFLPYGVAFKYIVILGPVTLPFCCWAFGRLARFRYPMPELFAFAGICFALNESYAIYGGNVKSTMAGEFSFSIAISLMVLGWGLLCRGLDEGKYRSWAAIVLALACLSHGIVLIYTIVGAIIIVGCRLFADLWSTERGANAVAKSRLWYATCVGGLTILLFAFWVGPFLFNHDYMTDMKYGKRPEGAADSFWDMLFDQFVALDLIINTLAVIGFAYCIIRRNVYGIAIGITSLVAIALVYLTRDSLPVIGLLWNPRVLPMVYLTRFLMMMFGVVEVVGFVVNLVRNRPARDQMSTGYSALSLGAGALAVLVVFGWSFQVLPFGGHRIVHGQQQYAWGPFRGSHGAEGNGDARSDGWSAYNFKGYEDLYYYPEYHNVVEEMDRIGQEQGCGRALWENNGRNEDGNGRYGTTMALMLLPFWTDGCIGSMEGLFFEASGSTPYMFLAAGAASRQSSNPVRELRYVNNQGDVAVDYLQALGVRYLMVSTYEAVTQADLQPELIKLAESGPWRIYQVADSDIVVPLEVQPVVVNGREGDARERFLELGTSWFQNQAGWAAMPADDGPDEWQRIDVEVDIEQEVPDPRRPLGTIDDPNTPDVVEAADTRGPQVSVVRPVQEIEQVALDPIEVTNVDIEQQSVEFDVSEVGVPVLVRVGYFPNWEVSGAEGPYRIGPNQMVVVPTEEHVKLTYGRSTTDLAFYALTVIGIGLAVLFRFRGDVKIPKLAGTTPSGGGDGSAGAGRLPVSTLAVAEAHEDVEWPAGPVDAGPLPPHPPPPVALGPPEDSESGYDVEAIPPPPAPHPLDPVVEPRAIGRSPGAAPGADEAGDDETDVTPLGLPQGRRADDPDPDDDSEGWGPSGVR
jgi:hypothetical protein